MISGGPAAQEATGMRSHDAPQLARQPHAARCSAVCPATSLASTVSVRSYSKVLCPQHGARKGRRNDHTGRGNDNGFGCKLSWNRNGADRSVKSTHQGAPRTHPAGTGIGAAAAVFSGASGSEPTPRQSVDEFRADLGADPSSGSRTRGAACANAVNTTQTRTALARPARLQSLLCRA